MKPSHLNLLRCYAERLGSVEMDSAFYRFPAAETTRQWALATPEDFTYSVRMSRAATHTGHLLDPDAVADCLEALDPLGGRLACVLFTTTPSMGCDVERVSAVLERLPDGVRSAWEFRDPSWLCPDVIELLVDHGSAPVVVEMLDGTSGGESLPGGWIGEKWDLPFVYVRFRRERYHVADILDWGQTLQAANARGADVYAYFRQSPESVAYAQALDEVLSGA